ncbi:MAG TPA: hypothetical protein VFY11_12725 [Nocardioidaceae bacterium]|nr:hypothetical protein [Nocardioidaceae bacterium]
MQPEQDLRGGGLLLATIRLGAAVVGLVLLGQWPSALALGLAYLVSAPIGRRGH